ncbi:MAG: hypothetical protein J6B85_11825 [Lachnospiraceae bacterium]|nr:hypothetical protein [Lachnospiraceae bacterium]
MCPIRRSKTQNKIRDDTIHHRSSRKDAGPITHSH